MSEAARPWVRRVPATVLAGLIGVTLASGSESTSDKKQRDPPTSHRGYAYIGAFFVTNIDSSLGVFVQDVPLGIRIDLSKQLKLRDSVTVPRLAVGWRFGRSHLLSFNAYDLSREGTKTIEREIEIPPDPPIPVGARVESFITSKIYRVSYTWLFHNDEKVSLGLGGGFFVADLNAGIRWESVTLQKAEEESLTAPLPVIGARLRYQITPKLGLLTTSDWMFVDYQGYRGTIVDVQLFLNHKTFKHVGFGAGLNVQSFNLEVDDEQLFWQIDNELLGFMALLTFEF
jgi:hypothetical protein